MGKYLNDCDIVVGGIYGTTRDGKIEVIKIEKGGIVTIRFLDSGNEYKSQRQTVQYGKIRDRNRDSTKEYVAACNEKHNFKYSYDKTVYTGGNNKVIVTCPTHGDFSIQAQIHKNQQGCPKCGWEICAEKNRMTTEQFISKSKRLFGEKFKYNNTVYLGNKVPLLILCPVHGEISITPNAHYNSVAGCTECGEIQRAENYRIKFDEFVSRAREIHGNFYSYVEESYTEMRGAITIVCPEHGPFESKAYHHVCNESGCPKCSPNFKRTLSEFVTLADIEHKGKYDYSLSDYINNTTPLKIICPEHGVFLQSPGSHLQGCGCAGCANWGFDYSSTSKALIYILKSNSMIKIGITNNDAEYRCRGVNIRSPEQFSVYTYYCTTGNVAYKIEQEVLSFLREGEIPQPQQKFDGYTEAFIFNDVEFVKQLIEKLLEEEYG